MPERVGHVPDALPAGHSEFPAKRFPLGLRAHFRARRIEPAGPRFKAAQCFLQRLLEGAADRHDLAHRLHLRGEPIIGLGKLLESEPRHFGHHVVDAGLEGCGRRPAGDLVSEFVERVSDGQLGGHFGDRKSRGLRGQRRRTRNARVHLDDQQPTVPRIDRELNIRAARIHADLAQYRNRGVAHQLVFLVGERLRGRHGDGVARVDPHGVQVLDGTDDDAVVVVVADDLHLEFLPPQYRFLQQHFGGRRLIQAPGDNLLEFLAVIGDSPATAAEGERWSHDRGETHVGLNFPGLLEVPGYVGRRHFKSDLPHRIAEPLAVFRHVDRFAGRADQLHAVLFQNPFAIQVQRTVQSRLPAHGG